MAFGIQYAEGYYNGIWGDSIDTALIILLFSAGLACIIWGGDRFVDAATWIAEVSGIPKFIVGATVVSVATTLPEIIVSVMAAASGQTEMASGNAIGSVTANTALILSLSIVFTPSAVDRSRYMPKVLIFIGAIILLWVVCARGSLRPMGSAALFLLFSVYICENISSARREPGTQSASARKTPPEIIRNLLYFCLGAAGIILGSRLLVDNGTLIAREILHVDERIISLTLVALGTSLPELVTAVTAIIKKQGALTAGNIIGANIIDMLLILPLCSLTNGGTLALNAETLSTDLPFCLATAVITLVPALICKRYYRWQGITTLALYGLYISLLIFIR